MSNLDKIYSLEFSDWFLPHLDVSKDFGSFSLGPYDTRIVIIVDWKFMMKDFFFQV